MGLQCHGRLLKEVLRMSFEECFARLRIGGLVVTGDKNISIRVFC